MPCRHEQTKRQHHLAHFFFFKNVKILEFDDYIWNYHEKCFQISENMPSEASITIGLVICDIAFEFKQHIIFLQPYITHIIPALTQFSAKVRTWRYTYKMSTFSPFFPPIIFFNFCPCISSYFNQKLPRWWLNPDQILIIPSENKGINIDRCVVRWHHLIAMALLGDLSVW